MKNLMVIDGSDIVINKIDKMNKKGFRLVAKAKSWSEALTLFKRHQPDIVTVDLALNDMKGIESIQELIKLNSKVRILVVSELSDKSAGIKALKYGARGFVCKPFSDEELNAALQKLIESPH